MKRKRALLLVAFTLIATFSLWLIFRISPEVTPIQKPVRHIKEEYGSYFFQIPIEKFTKANQPCISINIEGADVSSLLDLGFRGEIACSSELLSNLKEKKHLGIEKMYSVRGNEYDENIFKIEKIEIGPIVFSHPIAHEMLKKFQEDATFRLDGDQMSRPEPSKVGWELFGNTNLFLDLGHFNLAFCDSIETLMTKKNETESFIRAPLILERGLVEFDVMCPDGNLRCMLDTGSTLNILNTDQKITNWDSKDLIVYPFLKVNKENIGPVDLHPFPIKLPIHIDIILGMDFFSAHEVFLDFKNKYVYLSKKKSLN